MKKILILVAAAGLLAAGCNSQPQDPASSQNSNSMPVSAGDNQQTTQPDNQQPQATNSPQSTGNDADVKAFVVDGRNFSFSPKTITVSKGDKVKITFKDDQGFHDLVLDGYNVKTNRISMGGSDSFEFTADKTGSFPYYCSVGNHREQGMEGILTVN